MAKSDEEFLREVGKRHWAAGGAAYAQAGKPQSAQTRRDIKSGKVKVTK